ncbi:MAG: OmpA family protein [Rikenellaceae bacterium]
MNKIKQFLALAALAMTVFTAQAQDEYVFNPHWNLRAQVGAGYSIGETDFGKLISPAAALSVGYEFTPVIGLRLGASGWQARGGMAALEDPYKYNYVQGNLDVTFDIMNLFCDYKHDRLFSPYIFVGVGANYSFNNDEAIAISNSGMTMGHLWEDSKVFAAGRGGIGTDIRISDKVAFNVELNSNILSDKFNSKDAPTPDWQINALAGFTFTFGDAYKVVSKPKPAPKQAPKPAPAPQKKEEAKPAPAPKAPVKKEETVNVFFKIDSSKIETDEAGKIDQIVKYLNADSSSKVSLTGYADAKTGYSAYNQKISEKRTAAVKEALVAKGISSSRIVTDSKGDSVQPFSDNDKNRVVICVVK